MPYPWSWTCWRSSLFQSSSDSLWRFLAMMSQASFASGLFMAVKKCHKRFCKQTASTACWSAGFLAVYACIINTPTKTERLGLHSVSGCPYRQRTLRGHLVSPSHVWPVLGVPVSEWWWCLRLILNKSWWPPIKTKRWLEQPTRPALIN